MNFYNVKNKGGAGCGLGSGAGNVVDENDGQGGGTGYISFSREQFRFYLIVGTFVVALLALIKN